MQVRVQFRQQGQPVDPGPEELTAWAARYICALASARLGHACAILFEAPAAAGGQRPPAPEGSPTTQERSPT